MNKNSLLVRLINENDNWRGLLEEKNIKVKEDGNLAIFNYSDITSDFSDPVVCEARGIIIDLSTLEVVCWPYRKFCNYSEKNCDAIDWNKTVVAQEKVDGSIIKLWNYNGKWNWSTNGVIYAENADVSNSSYSYMDLIKMCPNYNNINYNLLNPNHCYIFELVYPAFDSHVVKYDWNGLVLTGERDNISGQECEPDLHVPFKRPAVYNLNTFESAILAVEAMNQDGAVDKEGLVVVQPNANGDWKRIKIKSSAYFDAHHARTAASMSREKLIHMVRDEATHQALKDQLPSLPVFARSRYYKLMWQMTELEMKIQDYMGWVRNYYAENNHERKAVAMKIKNDKFAYFGFKALDNDRTAAEMLAEVKDTKINEFLGEDL